MMLKYSAESILAFDILGNQMAAFLLKELYNHKVSTGVEKAHPNLVVRILAAPSTQE